VALQSQGLSTSVPPYRSVHVHDHVIEHRHYHVFNKAQDTVSDHPQSVLTHHSSEVALPAIHAPHTQLLEAAPAPCQGVEYFIENDASDAVRGLLTTLAMDGGVNGSDIGAIRPAPSKVVPHDSCDGHDGINQRIENMLRCGKLATSQTFTAQPTCDSSPVRNMPKNMPQNSGMPMETLAMPLETFWNAPEPSGMPMETLAMPDITAYLVSQLEPASEGNEGGRRLKLGNQSAQMLRRQLIDNAGSLREAFKVFDSNGSGMISVTEWITGLQKLCIDLSQLPGSPKAELLFRDLDTTGRGLLDLFQLFNHLEIRSEAGDSNEYISVGTMELWRKHNGRRKASKNSLERRAMWEHKQHDSGTAQLLRLQAETEKKKAREIIKRDWQATRPREEIRNTRELLTDPRLHRKCPDAINSPNEDDVIRDSGQQAKCVHNIKKAMHSCVESRRQVMQMQQLLRPQDGDEVGVAFAHAFRSQLRQEPLEQHSIAPAASASDGNAQGHASLE